MSSSFPFLPRTLSCKPNKKSARPATTPAVQKVFLEHQPGPSAGPSPSRKSVYSNQDYINLFHVALSDHSLWANPDLRRIMAATQTQGLASHSEGDEGFIPLNYLLTRSSTLAPLNLIGSQVAIVKALRESASDIFDMRLLMSVPSIATWSRNKPEDPGAYEIRRKDWVDALTCSYSKNEFNGKTVYVENIPVQHKILPSVLNYLLSLLSENRMCDTPPIRIQDITFPPHHLDKPGDQPKCRGFALVILTSNDDKHFLLNRWPWDRSLTQPDSEGDAQVPEAQEAARFGFRTLSKPRWDELREEYLAYRQQLINEVNACEDAETSISVLPSLAPRATLQEPKPDLGVTAHSLEDAGPAPVIDRLSLYPPNCLVFARNVHPETNKTTLRKLFATAFSLSIASGVLQNDGLDYVDYNKGMDSCHLRLATPKHAQVLVNHFTHHKCTQSQGLDDIGMTVDKGTSSIITERLVGKREELYWQKVPEKVRRQAVQKALEVIQQHCKAVNGNDNTGIVDTNGNEEGEMRKIKRRKR